MSSFTPALVGGAALAAVTLAPAAFATVLTFDFGGYSDQTVPGNYGSHVGNPTYSQPPGWMYGAAGGPTPHVSVVYGPGLHLGAATQNNDPTRVFGDLSNVVYRDRFGGTSYDGILRISLIADPGFQVCVSAFDLAAAFNSVTGIGEDLPIKSIQVRDAQRGVAVYRLDYDSLNPAPATIPGTAPLRHRHFDFSAAPVCSQSVEIYIDLNQILTVGGSKIDRFAIDNIVFSEIPSPGAAALLLGAGAMFFSRRRRQLARRGA